MASVGARRGGRNSPSCADGISTRPKRRPRYIGLDEIQRGKGQRFWTVLSDIVHGEVIGLRQDRSEGERHGVADQRADAAATRPHPRGLHRHASAVSQRRGAVLPSADIVFDKFHVLQHASAALDDVRRQEFFRAGAVMRERGPRETLAAVAALEDGPRLEAPGIAALFAANRRLFKAYVLREQLDRLWTYKTRTGVRQFPPRLAARPCGGSDSRDGAAGRRSSFKHLEGIAAYCYHPVRFGVVESINTTIKAVIRRARGMRDEAMLLSKLKWATAHPIRSARDLKRFLSPQGLHSNR